MPPTQCLEEFAVRAHQVGGVSGLQVDVAVRMQFHRAAVALDGDDPRLGGVERTCSKPRPNFRRLAVAARQAATAYDDDIDPIGQLRRRNAELAAQRDSRARLVQQYAIIINKLTLENKRLLKAGNDAGNVASIHSGRTVNR